MRSKFSLSVCRYLALMCEFILAVFSPTFVVDTKIVSDYNFVAPLKS